MGKVLPGDVSLEGRPRKIVTGRPSRDAGSPRRLVGMIVWVDRSGYSRTGRPKRGVRVLQMLRAHLIAQGLAVAARIRAALQDAAFLVNENGAGMAHGVAVVGHVLHHSAGRNAVALDVLPHGSDLDAHVGLAGDVAGSCQSPECA